jgi:hypothetical protein
MNTRVDPEAHEANAPTREELISLIRVDYETTRSLIDGVVRTSLALRGVGLTLVLALLTFAVEKSSVPVALCGLVAVGLFLFLDAYHGSLYAHGLRRAHELERILSLRYKELERAGLDADVSIDLDVALAEHRFGQYSNFPRFRPAFLRRARPVSVYLVLHGSLAALAIASVVYGALS